MIILVAMLSEQMIIMVAVSFTLSFAPTPRARSIPEPSTNWLASYVISSSRSALPRLACRYSTARMNALMVEAVSNSSSAPISTVLPRRSSTKTLILP